MTGLSPAQRAAACETLAEAEGFIAHAQQQLRQPDTDHAYWEAIRLAGLSRLRDLQRGRR